MAADGARTSISELLLTLVRHAPGERISLGELVEGLGDRAFGLAMLVLALPMALPLSAIPGVSTVFGVPLCIIATQLALGWPRPRLPQSIATRSFARAELGRMIDRALPWLRRIERAVHPRWPWATGPAAERAIGLVCLVLAVVMALPIPGGNQPPGIAISLFAVAVLERDGLFVLLGAVATVAAAVVLALVVGAFAGAAYVVFTHLFG